MELLKSSKVIDTLKLEGDQKVSADIDRTEEVRNALQAATSNASLLLTTEAMVAASLEPKSEAPGGRRARGRQTPGPFLRVARPPARAVPLAPKM